jgi:hypothetical protein
MDTEFMELENLEGYIRLPGKWPVSKLEFQYKKRMQQQPALVFRDFSDCQMLGMPLISSYDLNLKIDPSPEEIKQWQQDNQDKPLILIVSKKDVGLNAVVKNIEGQYLQI